MSTIVSRLTGYIRPQTAEEWHEKNERLLEEYRKASTLGYGREAEAKLEELRWHLEER